MHCEYYNSVATDPAKSCLHVCKLMWSIVSLAPKPEEEEEEKDPGFSCSCMPLIMSVLTSGKVPMMPSKLQMAETKPFLLLHFGPGFEASQTFVICCMGSLTYLVNNFSSHQSRATFVMYTSYLWFFKAVFFLYIIT